MSRLAPIGAPVAAALAAWLTQGTIGFTGAAGTRVAVLPVSIPTLLIAALAAALVVALRRAGASHRPLLLLAFLVLPWLPVPVPTAFLLWVRPASLLIWVAVVMLMLVSRTPAPAVPPLRRPRLAAAALACALFASSAWRVAPIVPGGDEPHYLIITQSLLLDHDLTIEDVHRRGDYRAYHGADLLPHVQRRGRNGQIYSVHAPGLPALVAPAFAVGGYPGVVSFLVLVAAAGSALVWHVAWMATRREAAAWFGWAAVTLPVTAIFHSFTVYPDGPGGVLTLTGLWALLRADEESRSGASRVRPWLLHGAALAMLPWLHSRFAVLAGGFGALVLLRLSSTKNPAAKAAAFLAVPAVSAVLWVGYFVAIYGRPDPFAAYGPERGSFSFVPGGLAGLLFDQRFGLVTYAPVLAVAFVGLGLMLTRSQWRRLGLELLFVVCPYLLTVTHFAMWWGGWSPPARFFAPVLALFAVPAAVGWTFVERRVSRVIAIAALVLTGCASAIMIAVDRGRLAFNMRDASALWLEWLGRLADLTAATPMWARETDTPLFRAIAVWVAAAAAVWAIMGWFDRAGRWRDRVTFQTIVVAALAGGVMAASSVVWALEGTAGRTQAPSQLELLGALATEQRGIALQLQPWSRLSWRDVPGRLQIELSRPLTARPRGPDTPPLFVLPPLPTGHYRLSVVSDRPRGWLMIGIVRDPRDPFALRTIELPVAAVDLHFPVTVNSLVIRGDEDAWRSVSKLVVQPIAVTRRDNRLTGEVARRAARYGETSVFFLDDRSFAEPQGFWVGGRRNSTVVLQPDAPHASARLMLRNGPVQNRVGLQAGDWRRVLEMGPGEEQVIEVPINPRRRGVVLRLEAGSGFRPAEHDPASRDQRFLGIWTQVATAEPGSR